MNLIMEYFPSMAAFVCFVSFFDNGYLIENNLQMQVSRIMEDMLDLKEDFLDLQKDIVNVRRDLNQDRLEIQTLIGNRNKTICYCSRRVGAGHQYELSTPIAEEKYGSSFSNYEVLKKLDMILKGLAKEKATRINFVKTIEAMEETYGQNLSDLATKIENVKGNVDNKNSETNANVVTLGNKLEDKVSTIEQNFKETMSKLNQTCENLYQQVEKWHLDQEVPHCDDGWREFQASCYSFIHINMSWLAAEQYCQAFSSHLIRIDDHTEFQFILGVLNKLHQTTLKDGTQTISIYWTAGNDIMKEGHWVWTPWNVPIKYAAWFEMEPNNYKGHENCAELASHRRFKMNDLNCEHESFFICEIDRKNG